MTRRIVTHLRRQLPNEGCGLIAFDAEGPVKVYLGTNVDPDPHRFRMDDREVLRASKEIEQRGWFLGAIFHSHPTSLATPSETDIEQMTAHWPKVWMVIVSFQSSRYTLRAWTASGAEMPVIVETTPPLGFTDLTNRVRDLARWNVGRIANPVLDEPQLVLSGAEVVAPEQAREPSAGEGFEPPRRATVGILGGMGPLATADLYAKVIQATSAQRDQDHIPVVIEADPRIPDRTAALQGNGEDPIPWLVRGSRKLAEAGVDFIVIPCNTAHAFLPAVQPFVEVPILSMIDGAADAIHQTYPDARVVGLLATEGTIGAELYQRALAQRGIDTLVPDDETQDRCVTAAIREVKAGRTDRATTTALLVEAAETLAGRGAQVILAACTEIPVVLSRRDLRYPLVDATEELAKLAVAAARRLDQAAGAGARDWNSTTTTHGRPGA
jgi:aspartate racemase